MNRWLFRLVASLCLWPLLVGAKDKPDEVEVKCLIPKDRIAAFSRKVGLDSRTPLTREVCFFDTEALSLFRHKPSKVILRSRYSAKETDTTVKIRDGKAHGKEVECEWDQVLGKPKIKSCSVTNKKQGEAEIQRANAGKEIKKIFSKEQEGTLESAFGKLDWKTLRPYGPVRGVRVWKAIQLADGPAFTVERWKLPAVAGQTTKVFFEISAKVSSKEADTTAKWISRLIGLPENGDDQQSETKTLLVLEHFKSPARR